MVAEPIHKLDDKQARRVQRVRGGVELCGDVTMPAAFEIESFLRDLAEIARRVIGGQGEKNLE